MKKARYRRGVTGIIIAGDLNLSKTDWDCYNSSDSTKRAFLDSFASFGLEQLINVPTHKLGNTLDLVLTDKRGLISDLLIPDFKKPCQSDHFCVCLISCSLKSISFSFKKIKYPKPEVLVYFILTNYFIGTMLLMSCDQFVSWY